MGSILIVDDDFSSRAMLSLCLRQAGHTVTVAAGGPEALGLLAERPFHALVTDGSMSPMDGFELCRRAKKIQPSLRVALTSALFNGEPPAECPCDRCFSKPVPTEELLAWIAAK